jgi:hypothetical protein
MRSTSVRRLHLGERWASQSSAAGSRSSSIG